MMFIEKSADVCGERGGVWSINLRKSLISTSACVRSCASVCDLQYEYQ